MGFLDKLKRDIKKGIDEGLEALKESTEVLKSRAEHVTEDLKSKVKVFELKQKIQAQLTELGGLVYEISGDKRKNPMRDEKVQKVLQRINRMQEQVDKLEGKIKEAVKKAKKSPRKTASKAKKKTATKASKGVAKKKSAASKGK